MIIGEVKRYLRDNNSIRVSRSVRDLAYKAMQFKEKYIREKGKEPTNDKEKMIITKRFFDGRTQMEVADEIGISQAQVSRLEKNAIEHIKRLYR